MALRRRTKNIFRFVIAPLTIVALLLGSYVYWPFGGGSTPTANAAWYDNNWNYRIKLSVNPSKVGGTSATTSQSFTSAGTFTVPTGVTYIAVKAWGGGGGGGGGGGSSTGGAGGGGGYASSTISVTPGETLTVDVGGGGGGAASGCIYGNGTQGTAGSGTKGPGGAGGYPPVNCSGPGGGGGGGSFVLRSTTILIAAGGGGGGGGTESGGGPGAGGGGGVNGSNGNGCSSTGGTAGGSGTSAGTVGAQPAGDASAPGGGGGGYLGGTGGTAPTCDANGAAGGGGGTNFGTVTTNGSGTTPGNSSDADRGTAGNGGASQTAGTAGKIVVYYKDVTLTNFPVYVSLSDLPSTVWSNMRSDCGDIRITTSDQTTEVPRELVSCDSSGKTGEMWFKAPSLTASTTATSTFYIYYGNSGQGDYATTSTYGAKNVWTNGYIAVFHLQEAVNNTAGGYKNSASSTVAAQGTGTSMSFTAPTGAIAGGKGQEFDGSADYISFTAPTGAINAATMSAWIAPDTKSSGMAIVNSRTDSFQGLLMSSATGYPLTFSWDNSSSEYARATGLGITAGSWTYAAAAISSVDAKMYLSTTSDSLTESNSTHSPSAWNIARDSAGNPYFDGKIDEVHIATTTRSVSWIQTEYNNQSSPNTFYSIGDNSGVVAFTAIGTTSWTVPSGVTSVQVLVVGGGGAGGGGNNGGGGGAGGFIASSTYYTTPGASITVTVGAGGNGTASAGTAASGGNSVFGLITAAGGGGGGGGDSGQAGASGGSGGGGAYSNGAGGSGNTPSVSPSQGNNGAAGVNSSPYPAGGGGGAGAAASGKNGGAGSSSSITGTATYYAGGGGGGENTTPGTGGTGGGGTGGGGVAPTAGTPNTGGGGGGAQTSFTTGASGGSGIVIVKYDTALTSAPSALYFSSPPADASASSIAMTSMAATDQGGNIETQSQLTGVLEYNFTYSACGGANDGTGGADSGWQTGTSYTNTGLQPNKCYGYKVQARDGLANYNATSTASTTYTAANTPGVPTLSSPTAYTLTLTNAENSNPASNPTTKFAAQITATSPTDSNWLNKYIDSDGTASSTTAWLTDAQLDGVVLQGLAASTTYTVKVMARNQDGDVTASSTSAQGTTLIIPGTPGTPTYSSVSYASMTVNWTAPAGASTYKLERCSGATNCTPVQIASSIATNSYNDSGLSGGTIYVYRVRATATGGDGAYSATSTQTTLIDPPSQPGPPTYSNQTSTALRVNWSASTGAVSYKVERCAGDNCTSFSEIATGVTTTYYDDSGLTPNTNYRYRVRGTNTTGDGGYSAITNTLIYNAPAGTIRLRGNIRIQ